MIIGCDVPNEEKILENYIKNLDIRQLRISLGWSLSEVQKQSTIKENLTTPIDDGWAHYIVEPIQTSYVLENDTVILFPPGRFLAILSNALHVTHIKISPHLVGLSIDEAFELADKLETLFLSAGFQENPITRTSREEATIRLQDDSLGYPNRKNLYLYYLGQTKFLVEMALFDHGNYAVTVKIINNQISKYWINAVIKISDEEEDEKVGITKSIDYWEYMEKLKKHGFLPDQAPSPYLPEYSNGFGD